MFCCPNWILFNLLSVACQSLFLTLLTKYSILVVEYSLQWLTSCSCLLGLQISLLGISELLFHYIFDICLLMHSFWITTLVPLSYLSCNTSLGISWTILYIESKIFHLHKIRDWTQIPILCALMLFVLFVSLQISRYMLLMQVRLIHQCLI